MRLLLTIIALHFYIIGTSQTNPYNRILKVNTGVSSEQFDHLSFSKAINDTASVNLDFVSWSPTLSYTHEFTIGRVLSLSGTVGFQYMNLFYGQEHYGGSYFFASVNPQLIIVHRKKFEYYIKLRVGATFYMHRPELIPEPTQRLFPETVNVFTGVTLGGFNYFINERIGLNLELSIWSPELATFGVSYRFYKGDIPEIQNNENENTDF